MNELGFVGRERELAELRGVLNRALAGHGQIAFIEGDAGSGKTALIRHFAMQAQRDHADLVVAVGTCNAQTGVGDPYLPFREVLTMLTTGDAETQVAQGTITAENAARLRKVVSRSVQVLVEVGPDLVAAVVPGAKLIAAVGKAVAEKVGWMDELEKLAQRKPGQVGTTPVEQNRLFEQYTNVLKALAAQQPLLIVVDDLHWVDTGSVALLFHLARRIERSRLLLVGSYRPSEVALGRDATRHPLEPVLNELKRYHGDITIDLGETTPEEARQFSDALLDSQPNQLGPAFRAALYHHTGGHPLFTVELLRSLFERGNLIRSENGKWVQGSHLDWSLLPARVEGVIAERLDRLEEELYNILCVASVEGVDFTAQVVAHVEQLAERELLKTLSHELERRHGLVEEQGELRVARTRLSRFRFTNTVFQQYLYDGLSAGERRLLHGEIATALETLYREEIRQIAVQLARHYDEAGASEQAAAHLIEAGDAATRVHAYAEARRHYDRALQLLEELPETPEICIQLVDTTIKLASVSTVAEDPERILERLSRVEPLARALPDPAGGPDSDVLRLARVQYWIGRSHFYRGKPNEAAAYYQQVMAKAQEIKDQELQVILSSLLAQAMVTRGRFDQALPLLEKAISQLESFGNWVEWIRCAAYHGVALAAHGRLAEAIQQGDAAIARARELNHPTALGVALLLRGWVDFLGGDMEGMATRAQQAIDVAKVTGDALSLFAGYGEQAWAQSRQGRLDEAAASFAESKEAARSVEGPLIFSDLFAAAEVELALRQGRISEALGLAESVVGQAQAASNLFAEGLAQRFWAWGLAALEPPQWEAAESHLLRSLEALRTGGAQPEVAQTHVTLGRLYLQHGDAVRAREQFEQALALFDSAGLSAEADRTRQRLAALPA